MIRRNFIKNSSFAFAGLTLGALPIFNLKNFKDVIIGHGDFRYKIDLNWGALNSNYYPVQDCHEMVQDSRGRIVLLTNHVKNNVIIYEKSGQLSEVWTTDLPGAHGLTLNVEGGEDFLYITDSETNRIVKTTLAGQRVLELGFPKVSDKYQSANQYKPTETAIAENGDIFVADGYGEQWILHYNWKGDLLNVFGGKEYFDNAHGIAIDRRDAKNPTLLITARQQNKLKRFSLDGKFISEIDLPGAFICRPIIHGKNIYLATIWSGNGTEGTGFISILDENDRLVSAPGGCVPIYENGALHPMYQALKIFHHPHDVCVDDEGDLYVAQWNSGATYPIKLIRQ